MSRMLHAGSKADGTDMHSVLARACAIGRDMVRLG